VLCILVSKGKNLLVFNAVMFDI